MTAAGEWLHHYACDGCGDRLPSPDPCVSPTGEHTPRRLPVDGAGAPPPAPAPSLVAGAIGRGVTDARERYRAELVALWRDTVAALPED